MQWYLTVKVVTNGNIPIPGAQVLVRDAFNDTIYNGTSDINGICAWIISTYYIENQTKTTYCSPHNVTGIASMGTGYVDPEPYIYTSISVQIIIIDRIPPVANAGLDQIIDQHENVTFNGSMSLDNIGINNWTWTFDYNNTPISLFGSISVFTFHEAGEYNVTLNITDGVSWAIDNMIVTVRDITSPIANAGLDIIIDQYETATFNGTGSYDNVEISSWTWRFEYNSEEIKLNSSNPKFTFNLAGEFNVSLNVTDRAGNWALDFVTVQVRDIENPKADAGPNQNVDQHEIVKFNGTGSTDNTGVLNWTWSFEYDNKSVILYGATPSFTFHTVGNYNVTLKVFDRNDNWGEDNITIEINDITPPIADAGSNITINQHQKVMFNGKKSIDNVGLINWTWTFEYNEGFVNLYGPTPSFIFDAVGDFTVTLNVTDYAGNWANDYVTVFVIDITKPIPNAGINLTILQNETITFNGTGSSDNVGIVNWTWTIKLEGVIAYLYGPTPSWTFTLIGNYTIILVVKDAAENLAEDKIWVNVTFNGSYEKKKEQPDIDEPPSNLGTLLAGIGIGIIILIIVIILLFFFVLKKKKDKSQIDEGKREESGLISLSLEQGVVPVVPGPPFQQQAPLTGFVLPQAIPLQQPQPKQVDEVEKDQQQPQLPQVEAPQTPPQLPPPLISQPPQQMQTEVEQQLNEPEHQTESAQPSESQPLLSNQEDAQLEEPEPQQSQQLPLEETLSTEYQQSIELPQAQLRSPEQIKVQTQQFLTSQNQLIPPLYPPRSGCPKCGSVLNMFPDGSFLCPKCGCIGK